MVDLEDAEEVVLAHALAGITRPRQFYRMACPFGPHNSPLVSLTTEGQGASRHRQGCSKHDEDIERLAIRLLKSMPSDSKTTDKVAKLAFLIVRFELAHRALGRWTANWCVCVKSNIFRQLLLHP